MRRSLVLFLLASLFLGAGYTAAQVRNDPPAKADPLEQLLAEAMKNNADIKVAEARLRLEEAKLEQTRADLKAKIFVAYAEVEAARAGFMEGKDRSERAYKLFQLKCISREEYEAAKLTMIKLQAELAVVEARLQALVGRPAVKKQPEKQKTP